MKKVDYWFSLSSNVFIWRQDSVCCFYDSETGKNQVFVLDSPELIYFVTWLLDIDHLYCVALSAKDLQTNALKTLIEWLVEAQMAKLIKNDDSIKRPPIQLPPLLNLQSDVDRISIEGITDMTVGEYVLHNLHELTIYLPKEFCSDYLKYIAIFFDALSGSHINRITIYGLTKRIADQYDFVQFLLQNSISKHIVIPIEIVPALLPSIEKIQIANVIMVKIVVSSYSEAILQLISTVTFTNIPILWEYQVTSEIECQKADELISILGNDNAYIKPRYNGNNLSFFEDNIYMTETEIRQIILSKREIFAHQALNTNDFGKLIVTENGEIYANKHFQPLGTIKDDLRFLVYKAMKEGTSWRRIRNMKPCCDCIYQWLCPSPSDYELEIGKPNLCHIRK